MDAAIESGSDGRPEVTYVKVAKGGKNYILAESRLLRISKKANLKSSIDFQAKN